MTNRKDDHIQLALQSNTLGSTADPRFDYDPIHGVHPKEGEKWPIQWGSMNFDYPIWVSSMTGGAERASEINKNLAQLCNEFNLGMGLGSCRKIFERPECIPDFQVRKFIGNRPLYANLGIAQCQQWLEEKKKNKINDTISITEADGLIIHINPLQEWMQTEGDKIYEAPIVTLKKLLDQFDFPIIVKEVGQGISKSGLTELVKLPLEAIEFGAYGGTNFSLLEMLRDKDEERKVYEPICSIGHTAEQMVQYLNEVLAENKSAACNKSIISGGVKNFLDVYHLLSLSNSFAICGMASTLLTPALESYESLKKFFTLQMQGLLLAKSYLKLKSE